MSTTNIAPVLPVATMTAAVKLAAHKLDAAVATPSDVPGAMESVRAEVARALIGLGCSNADALKVGTGVVLMGLKTLGVAWADEAIARFDALPRA
jgi:hypothetical protein